MVVNHISICGDDGCKCGDECAKPVESPERACDARSETAVDAPDPDLQLLQEMYAQTARAIAEIKEEAELMRQDHALRLRNEQLERVMMSVSESTRRMLDVLDEADEERGLELVAHMSEFFAGGR
jgi:hypothetical protein